MSHARGRRALLAAAALVAVAAGIALARPAPARPVPPLATAVAAAHGAGELNFTRWDRVVDEAGEDVDAAAARTFVTRSMLAGSDLEMDEVLGWTVTDLSFEAYVRGDDGDVVVAGLGPDLSADEVRDSLVDGGFTERSGVLSPGDPVLPPALMSQFAHVVVDAERGLLVAAAGREGLDRTLAALDDPAPQRAWRDVVSGLSGAVTVVVRTAEIECPAVSAGEEDADQVAAAVQAAGGLTDYDLAARAIVPGTDGDEQLFAYRFGSPDTAREQARVRGALATGPFIGRTGRFEDVLDPRDVTVDGATATMRFGIDSARAEFMSGSGSLPISWCASPR